MKKYKFEYIWLDGTKPVPGLRGKTQIKSFEKAPTLADVPLWGFDGSSTMQAEGKSSDCILKPVALYPDAARKDAYLVLCEVMMPDGTPHPSNGRATIKNDPDLWVGFEQEYFLYKDGRPLGFPKDGFPGPQGPYYCGVGYKNVGSVARQIVDEHLDLCLAAGINHEGINAEVAKGQWEFQIFAKGSAKAADDLWIARYLMIPDLFNFFLGGEKAVEFTETSTSEMYNHAARDWHRELLHTLSIPDRILPRVVAPASVLSNVGRGVLDLCGFSKSFPVIAVASHDTASAVASIPNLDPHSAFISSGTWSLMGVELDAPIATPRARQLRFTNEGGCGNSTLLLRNLTGLWLLQESLRQWQQQGHAYTWDDLIAAAEAQPFRSLIHPDANDFLAPADMLQAIRSFCQSTAQPVPQSVGEFARCCFESLSLSYWSTLDALQSLTSRQIRTLRVVGGGCLNAFLCQMTADACGCNVVSGPVEASALGNVMLQAVATGALPDIRAGRAALGESLDCLAYAPHPGSSWTGAQERYRVLEAASSSPQKE